MIGVPSEALSPTLIRTLSTLPANGAGISTTLKILSGYLSPTVGQVKINNLDITVETAPTYDFLNQLLKEVVIPISDISGNYLNSNYPKLSKILKWKYRKKLDKIEQVWYSGELTGENFIKFKSYRLLVYKK